MKNAWTERIEELEKENAELKEMIDQVDLWAMEMQESIRKIRGKILYG